MALEIERKFLVHTFPESSLIHAIKADIQQGYLILEGNRELRVRRKGSQYFLTEKKGSGLCREENEISINEKLFKFLWPMTVGMQVEKVRYTFMMNAYQFELDVYGGDLLPLMTLEVEFESIEQATTFIAPDFVSLDVTHDTYYKNSSLAKQSTRWLKNRG